MNENTTHVPGATARERRDQAFRLRKRIAIGAATGALLTVAGLGVLAEHSVAGTTTATVAASAATVTSNSSSTASSAGSDTSSNNSSNTNSSTNNSSSTGSSSSAPSIGRGRTSIVSGGS